MKHPLSRENCLFEAGQTFSIESQKYILGGKIGDGAAGILRKAKREENSSIFAVKFLAPDPKYIDEKVFEDVKKRFQREGKRGAKLEHANLLRIYSYCDNENGYAFNDENYQNPFILMEYVKGKTLENYIRDKKRVRGKFYISRERLNLANQIASALEYLRNRKLIHRDVKPANIFLKKSSKSSKFPLTRLGDFGIMKWGDFHASFSTGILTVTNQKGLGTFKYMSPEQAVAPKKVTVRADIFSLGITLFELFSGQILATPHHVFEIMNARLSRGNAASRFYSMGYNLPQKDEELGSLLLDMFLRGASGRPKIDTICRRLEWEYENRFNCEWIEDVY